MHRALLLVLMMTGGPVAAQSVTGRWSLQLRGPVAIDRGDLRIAGDSGRLLMESADTTWLPVVVHRGEGDSIVLVVAGRVRLAGSVSGDAMRGELHGGDAPPARWEAQRIPPGIERWPVRPRLRVRQVVVGRDDSMAVFSDEWRSRILTSPALLAEHAALAARVGFPPGGIAEIADRAQQIVLGFDPVGRQAATRQLEAIARSPAADREFDVIFRTATGGWRLDLHDVAWQQALAQVPPAALASDSLAAALIRLGAVRDRPMGEPALIHAVWQFWGRLRNGSAGASDPAIAAGEAAVPGLRGLRALLDGYDAGVRWWQRAVDWLLRRSWVPVEGGWRSPVDLVATFWERDGLALPTIEPHHFGSMQAVPIIGAERLNALLLVGANATGEEFLAAPTGPRDALAAWRALEFGEASPLRITVGPQTMTLASPATLARSRLGGFLAAEPAIRIDPGIMPIFAVGTVVHEWQHLLFEAARMAEPASPAIRSADWGVRLVEADPWLGEGAAEWATERVFAPALDSTPLFALLEAEKRLSIGAGLPDDTHVLGYLLVRAAMNRVDDAAALRRLLVAELHDPVALAVAIGLGGPATRRIPRPPTLVIIPEVTFTFDGGIADGAVRRVIVPALPVEP